MKVQLIDGDSLLFVKGEQSIWLMHLPPDTVVIYGPGSLQEHCRFESAAALDRFQVATAERLIDDGWLLWGAGRDRRGKGERRRVRRDTPDRRAGAS